MKHKIATFIIFSLLSVAFILGAVLSIIFENYISNSVFILLILVTLLIIFNIKRHGDRLFAAKNALLAKYTFSTLDQDKQDEVINKTIDILQRGGIEEAIKKINGMAEREKYSFFALAMEEIGINPAFEKEEWWVKIKNPFIVLIKADKEIKTIQALFSKTYGIKIPLE
jgi:hypothetical protein